MWHILLILFIYLRLCWVFVSARGLSLAVASGGHSSSRCAGLSLSRPLLLRSTGSRRAGSVVVAHGPSCSVACGILPHQGSNPCPLHWQADSQPLRHQGSPLQLLYVVICITGPNILSLPEFTPFSVCGHFALSAWLSWNSISQNFLLSGPGLSWPLEKFMWVLEKGSKAAATVYVLEVCVRPGTAAAPIRCHRPACSPCWHGGQPAHRSSSSCWKSSFTFCSSWANDVCSRPHTHQQGHQPPYKTLCLHAWRQRLMWVPGGPCSDLQSVWLSLPDAGPDYLRLNVRYGGNSFTLTS